MPPGPVVAGDFDGDGHADVIATRSPTGEQIRFFPGNGDGTFGAEVTSTPSGLNGFEGMQAADVDGDGKLDMIGNANTGAGVQVVRGNGDGTFTEVTVTPADVYAGDFVRDDFNGDGRADFAGTGWQSGIVSMPGHSDGSLGEVRRASAQSSRIPGLISGELDGDGLTDIITVGGGGLAVLINSSEQAPPPPPKPDLRPSEVEAPDAIEAGQPGSITYTVTNDGGPISGGSWVDRVYLSDDPVWDPSDPLFFSVARSGDLAAGADYEQTVTNPFIPEAVGDHHVIVRTDLFDAVDETDQADNLLVGPVVDVQIPLLAVDDEHTIDLSTGERAYRRVAASEADLLLEEAGPTDSAATMVVGDGRVPSATSYDLGAELAAHPSLVLPVDSDERVVLVTGREAAGTGTDVTLSLRELGFEVLGVSPAEGSNAGSTTVALTGAGFTDDVSVHLVGEAADLTATDVAVHDRSSLEARFDLTGQAVGDYTIEVRRGADTAALPDGFRVTDEAPGALDLHVSSPGVMRVNSRGTVRITVSNTGGTDLGVPLLRLSSPHTFLKGPGPSGAYHDDDLALFPRVASGPSRVIPPHGTAEIEVPFVLTPEVIAEVAGGGSTEIDFRTTLFRDDAPYGIDDFPAVVEAHRPAGLSDTTWATIKAAITSPGPATFGDYVQLIADVNLDALQFGRHLATEDEHIRALIDRSLVFTDGPDVAGQVHLSDGAPATVGQVQLLDGAEQVASGPIWPDGSFAVWDVPAGTYQVRVDGYLQPEALPEVVVPSAEALDLDVEVDTGDRLRGFVTEESDGRGIAGATVIAFDHVSGRQVAATTGPDGRYEILGLRVGPKDLTVEAEGFARHGPVELDVDLSADATLDVALVPGSGLLGTVFAPDSSPVAGAVVTATSLELGIHREVETGADGTYSIDALPAGSYDIQSFVFDIGTAFADDVVVDGVTATTVDLTLGPDASITGQVTDTDGAPVAGAEIEVTVAGFEPFEAVTDASGSYGLHHLPPGDRTVIAHADGFLERIVDVTLAPGETATMDVELLRTGTITGQVTLPNGSPVPGLDITVVATTPTEPVIPPFVLHTDADGRYAFDPLPMADYRVSVRGDLAQATTTLDATDPDQVLDFEVQLGWIEGRIVDEGGAPLAGVTTFVRSLDRPDALPIRTLTDLDGRYRYYVTKDGSYEVFVADERVGLFALSPIDAVVGETTTASDTAPATSAALEVAVTDDADAPVAHALVELRRTGQHARSDSLQFTTDATGSVRFPALEPGEYEVAVRAEGWQIAVATVDVVDGDSTAAVELAAGHSLSGTALAPGGEPLGSALVTLIEQTSGERYYVGTRPDGTWVHSSLPPGTYDGWIVHRQVSPIQLHDLESTPAPVGGAGALDPAVAFSALAEPGPLAGPATAVTGVVIGPGGHTIAHAEIELVDAHGDVVGTTTSDASGTYDVPAVPGNGFSIRVRSGDAEQSFPLPPIPAEGLQFGLSTGFDRNAIPPAPAGESDPLEYLETWVHGLPQPEREPRDAALEARLGAMPTECPPVQAAWLAARRWLDNKELLFGAWTANYQAFRDSWQEFAIPAIRLAKLVADLVGLQHQLAAQVGAGVARGIDPADILSVISNLIAFGQTAHAKAKGGDIDGMDWAMDGMSLAGDLMLDIGRGITAQNVFGGAMIFVSKANDAIQIVEDLEVALADRRIYIDGYNRSKRQYLESLNLASSAIQAFERAREIGCPDPDDPRPPKPKPDDPSITDNGDGTWTIIYDNHTFIVNSRDPNSVEGPAGYGDDRWVARSQRLDYVIHFENDPDASAPAQEVTVTHQLDPSLDPASLELGDIGFGSVRIEVPDGLDGYETTVPLAGTPYGVAAKGWLDPDTRTVTWRLRTIDPATGDLPTDPLAGFLPPNDAGHAGEGFLELSVEVLPSTLPGTTVSAAASIVFDQNEPIVTDPWTNRIDVEAPKTPRAGLPDESLSSFLVSWPATDDGSGAVRYFVHVSVDGGAFEPWMLGTSATSATFTGEVGRTYSFEVNAIDGVGHVEPARVSVGTTRVTAVGEPPPPGGGGGGGGGGGSGGAGGPAAPPADRDLALVPVSPKFTG
jgi:hypothetical protein